MKKNGAVQTILIVVGVYLFSDLVIFKGFLHHFLEGFLVSMKEQGKIGLVTVFIGLAIAAFGLVSGILGQYGRTLIGPVVPERLKTHRILTMVLGTLLFGFGVWLTYYGLTANR